eukprot:scaffold16.g26.t1
MQTSLDPRDYLYPVPSREQAEQLVQQARLMTVETGQLGDSHALEGAYGSLLMAQDRLPLASATEELPSHLMLDMDDDCLRLLLGEEGDECKPTSSGGSASTCGGGSAQGPAAAHADSAAPGEGATAAAEEEEELLLEGAPLLRHDDPSVVLSRGAAGAPACPPAASADPSAKCCSGSEGTTLSTGLGAEEDGAGQASPLKRAKSDASEGGAPLPLAAAPCAKPPLYAGLMLSMDYQSAVESINLQLTLAEDDLSEGMLPITLSLVAGAKTPEGPDLLSPASKWGLAAAGEEGGASAKRQRR